MIDESHSPPKGCRKDLDVVWERQVGASNGRVSHWGWSPASLCLEVSVHGVKESDLSLCQVPDCRYVPGMEQK